MQLKYSFKKEWAQFWRTGRFWGVIAGIALMAFSYPLMFKAMSVIMSGVGEQMTSSSASIGYQDGAGNEFDFNMMGDMMDDGGMMFAMGVVGLASYSLLIIMLLLMSAAGGEQKKRAMIVPMCAGLKYENYLTPKFVIYPLVVFIETFVSCALTGAMCTVIFTNNLPTAENILISSVLMSVYMAFITTIYLSVGLCTSRPGVMVPVVFLGQMILQSLLEGFGLTDYHPFALITMISRINSGDVDVSENLTSIGVSVGLSIVISLMMYFLALGVLKAKKTENQAEIKPEF